MANIGNQPLKDVFQKLLQLSSSGEIADVTGSAIGLSVPSGGGLTTTGHLIVGGNISASGTITANTYHVQQITSSVLNTSGSTRFGNSSDDVHTFSGSVYVKDSGHITASGNISASNLITNNITATAGDIVSGR